MNTKLFSIITPTYNCKEEIEKTINSVLLQKKSLFEYIIIDGNSNDGTIDIIKKYKDKFKIIIENDDGIYDAMNKGISIAKGKYLYFLGAGDCLRKDILEKLKKTIPKTGIYFFYGDIMRINPYVRIICHYGFNKWNIGTKNIYHQAIFYHKDIFELLGKYDLKYRIAADYCKNIECFGNKYIKKLYINLIIANYMGKGISDNVKDEKFIKEKYRIILDNLGYRYYIFSIIRDNIARILGFFRLKSVVILILEKLKLRL
ncbi:MAG: glycosyltransferase [Candidatus Atribacteria bacterium]